MQNQLLQDTLCANFEAKRTTFTFSDQICLKKDFGVKFWKTKSGCRINSSKISCVLIFRPNGQLLLFRTKFAQKKILGSEFRNSKPGFWISTSNVSWMSLFRQNGQLWIFGPNLPKKGFWGQNFEILSLDSESAPPIYHEHQFSGKKDNFEFSA